MARSRLRGQVNNIGYVKVTPSNKDYEIMRHISDGESVFVGGVSGRELVTLADCLSRGELDGIADRLVQVAPDIPSEVIRNEGTIGIRYDGSKCKCVDELINATQDVYEVAKMLAFISGQFVLETMPVNSTPEVNFTFRHEYQGYYKMQGNCYNTRQRLEAQPEKK